ncbi:MAG: hypothetical protein R3F59_08595 [Myxococcota bacterium]
MAPPTLFFLHVPKTAGRYIVSVALHHELREGPFLPPKGRLYRGTPDGRLHYGGHNVVRRSPRSAIRYFTHCARNAPGWEESVRFTVLRNPFDLLVSMFSDGWPYGQGLTDQRFGDFPSFVDAYCDPDFPWLVPDQQHNLFFQLLDEDGSCPIPHRLRQERLDDDLAAVCAPLGIVPVRQGLHKASRFGAQRDHRAWYSDALREKVEQKCAFELSWGGYDFDGLVDRTEAA